MQLMRFRARTHLFCSNHRTFVIASEIALFIIISMTIGILIVFFTTPNKKNRACVWTLKSIGQNTMNNNSHPKALVVHDFNNDNKADIAVANSGTDNIGILLGNNIGTFSSQVTYPTGKDSQPSSVAIGDFDNDHQLDIVVANYGTHNIGILLSNGDGTFQDQATFSTGSSRPLSVTISDLDNDSRLDIVIVNYGTNSIGVLLGYDNGSFKTQIILSTGFDSLPFSALIGDFNNDDKLDIVIANHGTDNIEIFLGDGNGTFPTQTISSTGIGSQPYAIAVADLNNDTKLDIVVANYGSDNICLLFGHGNGTFDRQGTYSAGKNSKPMSVIIDDFNNDNQLDIGVSNSGTNNIEIFLGNADGTYTDQTSFPTGLSSQPYFIAAGDFNNDDWLDIVVANYEANTVEVLLAYFNVTLSSQMTYSTGLNSQPVAVGVGDFNNDSLVDIVIANNGSENIGFLFGYGNGQFADQITYSTGDGTYPVALAIGDLNNDNLLDIVIICVNDYIGQLQTFLGNTDVNLSNIRADSDFIIENLPSIAVGDFNDDNRLDIVIIAANSILVILGNGDGTFSDEISYAFLSYFSPQSIAVGDFNNDSQLDIVVANTLVLSSLTSNVGVFLGYGNGTFADQMTFYTGYYSLTQSVAVGDFNNDSRLDIVVANPWNDNIGILFGYGNGTFSNQKTESTGIGSSPSFVAVDDFNNDSRLDILVISMGSRVITIFLGAGNGTFSDQLNYPIDDGSQSVSVAIGDFNKDSLMDIVMANSASNTVDVMLGIRNVNFLNKTAYSTGSSPGPCYVVVSDLDNNNQADIAVVNYITNNIGVFLADDNGNFLTEMTYAINSFSFPTAITVADFNKDMALDIAIADSGTNSISILSGCENRTFKNQMTYAIADGSKPQSIAHGDFNNDSRPDIVVANYGNDNVNVLLSSNGGLFRPEVSYPTGDNSHPLAIAVGDMNNDRILDIVVANNGYDNIGIFFGNSDGTFSGQKTYYVGYQSYPSTIAIGDFNNDEKLDIVVVGNAAFMIFILLQNEKGNFSVHTSYYVPVDSWPTTVAIGDLNNDARLDIILGNSETNDVYVFLGIGNGNFSKSYVYQIGDGSGLTSIAIGDLNNDNRLDIAIANTWDDSINVRLGNGDGTFSDQKNYPTNNNSFPTSVAIADFDNDNRPDIVVTNRNNDNVGVLFGYGNGTFEAQVIFSTGAGSGPTSIAVGDLNNDGRLDIVVAHSQSGTVGVLLGYVNRMFFSQIIFSIGYHFALPNTVVVGHFNNDTLLDIAVCNGFGEIVSVFLALPGDIFLSVPPYETGFSSQPTYIAVGDFNNDTRLDIAVANYGTHNIMILLGSGDGTIASEMTYSTGYNSQPCWIAIGDLNNDNRLDIIVANSGTDNIGIFFGYGNGTFSSQIIYSTGVKSQPTSVIIDDFNNDTQLDIAVANFGTNSVGLIFGYGNGSFASQILFSAGFDSRPIALASGDVNNDNLSDIVIANNGYGNIQILYQLC